MSINQAHRDSALTEDQARKITGAAIAWGGGAVYNLSHPNPEIISIEDMAYALAYTCRWRGQTRLHGRRVFFGVAQHVVFGAEEMLREGHGDALALQFLFHEPDEVVFPDIPGPAKAMMPDYKMLAKIHGDALLERFEVTIEDHEFIKHWDNRMMVTEKRDLLAGHSGDRFQSSGRSAVSEVDHPPFERRIRPYAHPDEAANRFLQLYGILRGRA